MKRNFSQCDLLVSYYELLLKFSNSEGRYEKNTSSQLPNHAKRNEFLSTYKQLINLKRGYDIFFSLLCHFKLSYFITHLPSYHAPCNSYMSQYTQMPPNTKHNAQAMISLFLFDLVRIQFFFAFLLFLAPLILRKSHGYFLLLAKFIVQFVRPRIR